MTLSVRERLAAKAVRTAVVQIPVGDPPPELRQRAVEQAERAVYAGIASGGADALITPEAAALVSEAAAASAAELAEFFAPLKLRAISAADWEAILQQFATDDDDVSEAALPVMVAACCADEELRDADWWREQLGSAGWTYGDRKTLEAAVFRLNAYLPLPSLGKG